MIPGSGVAKHLKPALPFAVVALLPFLLYWKLFTPDPEERLIFRGDFLNQHYVWKSYALERVGRGELPLWNPHLLGGVAFHANPQVGIFYPPTHLLLPFHEDGQVDYLALEAYQLLHQAFGGAGMLLLMRALGVGTLAALASAVVFMFTGFFTTPGHHAIVVTASWIPWVLLAVKRVLEHSSAALVPLAALALAAMMLGGHPQIAYYGMLLAAVWALTTSGLGATLRRFLPASLLAIGISLVQLAPTYQLAVDSSRAELGYDYATSFGLSPYFLSAAVAPRGQIRLPDQDGSAPLHLYTGIGTLLLAAVALTLSRHRTRRFFAGTALLALLLSFGNDSPVYDLFYAGLPGFGSFRVPYRLLGLYVFSMAALAGLGMEVLASAGRRERARLGSLAKASFLVLLALGLWAADVHVRLLSGAALGPADVERVVSAAYWAVLLAAINFLLLLGFLWRPRSRIPLVALVAVLAVDMGAFVKDRAQHPYRTLVRAGERPIHRLLREQGYRSRYVTDSNLESYDMLYGTEFAGGHAALVDARYAELLDLGTRSANALALMNVKFVVRRTPEEDYPWCGARFASPLPLLDVTSAISPATFTIDPPLTATRLVLYWSPLAPSGAATVEIGANAYPLRAGTPVEVDFGEPSPFSGFRVVVAGGNPGVRLEDIEIDLNPIGLRADFIDLDGVKINLHALPRAYFMVPSEVPSEIQTIEALECWTALGGVQVTDPETGEGSSGYFRKDAVEILSYEPERIEIETRSPRAGYVVLADTFRPGWRAEVDGVESQVARGQRVFRAVAVPEGEHRVRLDYRPESLRLGLRVSVLSLALAGLWPFALRLWRRRKAAPPQEDPDPEPTTEDAS